MVVKRGDYPDDFDGLKNVHVELPEAEGESEMTCPIPMSDILEHLAYECPGGEVSGGEKVIEMKLRFARTADVDGKKYWVWLFEDEENAESFVLVGKGENELLVYDETYGMTPEQIVVAQHFDID